MTYRSRWLLVLGVVALSAIINVQAQDALEALLQDLGGKPAQKPEVRKPAEEQAAKQDKRDAVDAAPAQKAAPAAKAEPKAAVQNAQVKPKESEKATQAVASTPQKSADKKETAAAQGDNRDQEAIISELMTLETIRRQSLDDHGLSSLENARKLFKEKEYEKAREQYKQALDYIVARPSTEAAINEARQGMRDAYYEEAMQSYRSHKYDQALLLAGQALERGHPKAQNLVDLLRREPEKAEKDASEVSHVMNEESHKEDRDLVSRRLRLSRQHYTLGDYDKALEECELVLREFPNNSEAMRLRKLIGDRDKLVADLEFEATRTLMIRDVRDAWTPDRYAINSEQVADSENELTSKTDKVEINTGRTNEQIISEKLQSIIIPEVSFRPPATIIDAVDFFKQASRDYDDPEIPVEQRGVNLVLKLGSNAPKEEAEEISNDPFAAAADTIPSSGGVPQIQAMSARFISLYDALKLVCDVTGMKFRVRGNIVMIVPMNDPDDELITRAYNVLPTLTERLGAAASEIGSSASTGTDIFMTTSDMGEKQDWKKFFEDMGVQWPDGSSISYMATIGKLRVTNTSDQLASFERVLEDLNVTPRLIEIEARFVEVSQNDLNSLGFEWLLNSDFSFDAGGLLDKALNLKEHSNKLVPVYDANGNPLEDVAGNELTQYAPYNSPGGMGTGYYTDKLGTTHAVPLEGLVGSVPSSTHNMSVGKIDGNNYSTGMRYLSTEGNPIVPEGATINDNFMRVNAFLGNADVSMILHMLSQRSDSDLLSAPKVVTKSGQEAVMKVVTEYIYPTEFEVTMSQQGNTGGISDGSSGDPLAIVEPQNFEMREVGVILQVVPEVSAEGQMINLLLNPQVVSEPVWKNYGTKVPKTVPFGVLESKVEYIELPMEQPFFPVRSVSTQLSIYNGATVVMGGLINENRVTIEDKIPFLGDLPYMGRFFRSRSEQSDKRNLLVFVTARLVDPAGRVIGQGSRATSPILSGGGGGAASSPSDTTAASVAPEAPAPAAEPVF